MKQRLAVLRRVLGNVALRRVALAFLGFGTAEYGVWVAVLVFAYGHGGTTMSAVVAVLQLLPAAAVAPFGATLADRSGGAWALRVGYLLQAVTIGLSAVAMLVGAAPAIVYIGAVFAASAVTLTRPAQGALLPMLVRTPEELTAANVVWGWVESASLMIGPALAGVLITIDGSGLALAVFACVTLGSATLIAPLEAPAQPDPTEVSEQLVDAPREVLGMLRRSPGVSAVLAVIAVQYVAEGAMDVLEVVLAIKVLSLGPGGAGYLAASFGAGAVAGGFIAITLVGRQRLVGVLLAAAFTWGGAFIGIGLWPSVGIAFAFLAGAGVGRTVLEVTSRTTLHKVVPPQLHGRVFGVLEGVAMLGLAVGSLSVSVVIAAGGARAALFALGGTLLLVTVASSAAVRALERDAPDLERELALLRGSPLFNMLAAPVIEDLARATVRVDVSAGATIIRQGEHGERFYLLADGALSVTVDGAEIRRLEPGYGFGEIALLDDGTRTATVTALEASTVYALDRAPFLGALTGSFHARRAADELATFHRRSDHSYALRP